MFGFRAGSDRAETETRDTNCGGYPGRPITEKLTRSVISTHLEPFNMQLGLPKVTVKKKSEIIMVY